MRIGFDCAKLVKGTSNSVGIYNVTKSEVTKMASKLPKEHQLVVIGNESNREDFDVPGVEFHAVTLNINSNMDILLWETLRVNSYIKKFKIDEIVFPRGFTSMFCPAKDVVFVHDLIPFYYHRNYPGELGKLRNMYVMIRMKSSIKTAKKVITSSVYSADDICKLVPKAKKKISVVLHGFEKNARENLTPRSQYENYFFGITSKLSHKNADGLINAYIEYYKMTEHPYDLEVAGIRELEFLEKKYGTVVPEEIKPHIHFNKFLDDEEFYSLFKYSKGLVFLSKIEGFGLPPLEAMELGVPVVSSNASSLPEVVREGGILVEPNDAYAAAQAMKKITEDEQFTRELVTKGYANLDNFSWDGIIDSYIEALLK